MLREYVNEYSLWLERKKISKLISLKVCFLKKAW